jgi:hypothetical protein
MAEAVNSEKYFSAVTNLGRLAESIPLPGVTLMKAMRQNRVRLASGPLHHSRRICAFFNSKRTPASPERFLEELNARH